MPLAHPKVQCGASKVRADSEQHAVESHPFPTMLPRCYRAALLTLAAMPRCGAAARQKGSWLPKTSWVQAQGGEVSSPTRRSQQCPPAWGGISKLVSLKWTSRRQYAKHRWSSKKCLRQTLTPSQVAYALPDVEPSLSRSRRLYQAQPLTLAL